MTGLGLVLYMVTRKSEANFAARRDNIVTDQLNAEQSGMATDDLNSGARREFTNEDGSRNVRSSISGEQGLYYGDALRDARRQADRRAGVTRTRASDGGAILQDTNPPAIS